MNVQGKIKLIKKTQTFDSGFRKRELVVTTQEQYPQDILIEFIQDKVDLLNAYKVGQSVNISINLRGREWINPQGEAKYFNTIQGWKIDGVNQEVNEGIKPPFEPVEEINDDEFNDLPF